MMGHTMSALGIRSKKATREIVPPINPADEQRFVRELVELSNPGSELVVTKGKAKLDPKREEQLLAAIRDRPRDDAARIAYVTWLAGTSDPIGRLGPVQHAARLLGEAERAVLAAHADELTGPLAQLVELEAVTLGWVGGFIRSAEIDLRTKHHVARITPNHVIPMLLEHPSARFLSDISLRGHSHGWSNNDYQPLIDLLVERRPTTLRHFSIAGTWGSDIGDHAALWSAFPDLLSVSFFGSNGTFGAIEAAKLKRFSLTPSELTVEHVTAVAAARLPKLAELSLHGMSTAYLDAFNPVLAGKALPALADLQLDTTTETVSLLAQLAKSKLAGRLTSLALWNGDLVDKDAKSCVAALGKFPKLKTLYLAGNQLTAKGAKAFATLAIKVSGLDDQRS